MHKLGNSALSRQTALSHTGTMAGVNADGCRPGHLVRTPEHRDWLPVRRRVARKFLDAVLLADEERLGKDIKDAGISAD